MKRIYIYITLGIWMLGFFNSYASYYSIVINSKLMMQLTANNAVRLTSTHKFADLFKTQREMYEENEKQMKKVYAIHEYIYDKLYNVNSLFRQGKQVQYIGQYIAYIFENGKKMTRLSAQNPQYSIWLTKHYQKVFEQTLQLKNQLEQVLLKPKKGLLMDAYDRDELIDNTLNALRQINVSILDIINLIEFGKSYAYIYSIPILKDYVSQDKIIVESILDKYKMYKYY